jgi:hypothetical protein
VKQDAPPVKQDAPPVKRDAPPAQTDARFAQIDVLSSRTGVYARLHAAPLVRTSALPRDRSLSRPLIHRERQEMRRARDARVVRTDDRSVARDAIAGRHSMSSAETQPVFGETGSARRLRVLRSARGASAKAPSACSLHSGAHEANGFRRALEARAARRHGRAPIARGVHADPGHVRLRGRGRRTDELDIHSVDELPPNLLDAAKNDRLSVYQLESGTQNGLVCVTAAKSASVSVTMIDGQPSAAMAPLTTLPQAHTATVSIATTQFEAMKGSVNPNASVAGHGFELYAVPGAPSNGYTHFTLGLLSFHPATGADLSAAKLTFGDPYGGTMFYAEALYTNFAVPVAAPGASKAFFDVVWSYAADQATFEKATVVPIVTPVTNVMVDGKPTFFSGGALAETAPTLSFSPPATGSPARNQIQAYLLTRTRTTRRTSRSSGRCSPKAPRFRSRKESCRAGRRICSRSRIRCSRAPPSTRMQSRVTRRCPMPTHRP